MRNINEIINTIYDWQGTFGDLAEEFTNEEYKLLFEEGTLEYTCDEWITENCYDVGKYADMLYYFISDWLMACIASGCKDSSTDNLYRLWKEF